LRELSLEKELERIQTFIRDYLRDAGFNKVVLGLSGGVDSSVCAALAVRALGRDNVTAVMLPHKDSSPESRADAMTLIEQLGCQCETIDITPMVEAYLAQCEGEVSLLRKGNLMARIRMTVLYDLSSALEALVLGTSNRTELMLGYFTQYGDSACAFEPIGHLYKTEVWKIARLLHIPEKIINKTPSADLWPGQTDEAELGLPYKVLDEIVYALTELDINIEATQNLDYPADQYRKVDGMIQRSSFKRVMPGVLG